MVVDGALFTLAFIFTLSFNQLKELKTSNGNITPHCHKILHIMIIGHWDVTQGRSDQDEIIDGRLPSDDESDILASPIEQKLGKSFIANQDFIKNTTNGNNCR